jgi:hypothetical protein
MHTSRPVPFRTPTHAYFEVTAWFVIGEVAPSTLFRRRSSLATDRIQAAGDSLFDDDILPS